MGRSKSLTYILLIFLSFVAISVFFRAINGKPLVQVNLTSENKPAPPLQKIIEGAMDGAKGDYAIVIENMKTGESYSQNANKIYEPGSLYKLWVMSAVFEKIQKGEIKEEEILSRDIAFLNREFSIAPEDAEFTSGVVTLSVKNALHQMIVISHNNSALLLTEKIKTSGLKTYIRDIGLQNSDTGTPPQTTASDTALFFEKLYRGELISPEYSAKMIALLKEQQLDDGLPKYLPKDANEQSSVQQSAIVAHKTGDIGWFKHDAGIVFTPNGDYIIVVMSESDSPAGAQERIALVSKAVYEYFIMPSKNPAFRRG